MEISSGWKSAFNRRRIAESVKDQYQESGHSQGSTEVIPGTVHRKTPPGASALWMLRKVVARSNRNCSVWVMMMQSKAPAGSRFGSARSPTNVALGLTAV